METDADFEEVELALHALVTAGHIDVDNDPDTGVVLYLFPELVGRPAPRRSGSSCLTCPCHPAPTSSWMSSGLRRCLGTTNVIDNAHSGMRRRTGRVTRWRDGSMAVRWAAAAFLDAEKGYRRIMGYKDLLDTQGAPGRTRHSPG